MQLVHKKDFVKSVQYYPHKALNTSNEKRRKSKEIEKAVKNSANCSFLPDVIDILKKSTESPAGSELGQEHARQ